MSNWKKYTAISVVIIGVILILGGWIFDRFDNPSQKTVKATVSTQMSAIASPVRSESITVTPTDWTKVPTPGGERITFDCQGPLLVMDYYGEEHKVGATANIEVPSGGWVKFKAAGPTPTVVVVKRFSYP